MSKNILILSYVFPPYPGIGGRRWAKFAKYLSRKGDTVHVVCAENPFEKKSLWTEDIESNPNIIRHFIPPRYPTILLKQPITVFEKIQYRASLLFIKTTSKGSYYDRALYWRKKMLLKATEIIRQHKVKNVIVSGAPFRICYYSIELKKIFSDLNIICDLRDPWTWGENYGFKMINKSRFLFEEEMESFVMHYADKITVPATSMLHHLIDKYPSHKNKIHELSHGFDDDDLPSPINKNDGKTIRIIYGGTLYDGLVSMIDDLIAVVRKNHQSDFIINFYTFNNKDFTNINSTDIQKKIIFSNAISSKNFMKEISCSDYYLIIFPDQYKDIISTKFYEVIRLGIPIIYIGNAGKVSEFITDNNIGLHILPSEINTKFAWVLNNKTPRVNMDKINIHNFSFESLVNDIENLLI